MIATGEHGAPGIRPPEDAEAPHAKGVTRAVSFAVCQCGYVHDGHRSYVEKQDDIADLERQANEAGGTLAALIRTVKRRLQIEDRAEAEFEKDLRKTYDTAVSAIKKTLIDDTGGDEATIRAAIQQTTVAGLRDLLRAAGLDVTAADFTDKELKLIDYNVAAAKAQGVPDELLSVNQVAVGAAIASQATLFWEQQIEVPSATKIWKGLQRQVSVESLPETIEAVRDELQSSVGRAKVVAMTELEEFDRTVAEEVATQTGFNMRLYMGPLDGLTRDFCRAIVNKVLTLEQIAKLDNGQTAVSPLFSGGGYRCRHRFVAVPGLKVGRRDLEPATNEDIKASQKPAEKRRARARGN